jgi:hypothetical protein
VIQCLFAFILIAGFFLLIAIAAFYRWVVRSCSSLSAMPEPLPDLDHRNHLYTKL